MNTSGNSASKVVSEGRLILAIDTCGPSGSVALGRLVADGLGEILGQIELEGRSYSSTLVAAVGELLAQNGVALREWARSWP